MKNYLKLFVSIFLPFLAGFIGSVFTMPNIDTWYKYLNKPILNPPNWIFGPVWTILYITMGVSLFLVWRDGFNKKDVKKAVFIFLFQLFLNTLWSIVFFGFEDIVSALICIISLWCLILATIISFYRISRFAGLILIPYLIWVSFASYLNFAIWILN